jgi:hypothetical protein
MNKERRIVIGVVIVIALITITSVVVYYYYVQNIPSTSPPSVIKHVFKAKDTKLFLKVELSRSLDMYG